MKLLIGFHTPPPHHKNKNIYIRFCFIIFDLYVYTDNYVFKNFSTVYNILNLIT